MQFGFFVRAQYPRHEDMALRIHDLFEQARRADELGFDAIFAGMHYASYPLWMPQLLPFLARLSGETKRARLVAGLVLIPLHKPIDVAEQIATIDVMSGGRVVFGAGLGYRDVEFKAFGTAAADKSRRFAENLEAIVRLWKEDHVTLKGSHFELDDASLSIKPLQKPHPPIWIGANADGAVRRAAKLADSWFINPHQRTETIARQIAVYRRALAELGKPFPRELPLMRETFVARTREQAIRIARPYLEEKYRVYRQWGQDKAMPGDETQGFSADFDELAHDRFLIGTPDDVAAAILDYRHRLGVTMICASMHWVGMPQGQALDAMQLFAEEVMPKTASA
ncbi:MAG: LLM class flavin-dependent oxidoreductase [Alphaproteobacteria bacterium]|nr:LLM class flavin-dependent oxidoreductase [Alphaproteobacteria bacterium]